MKFRVSMGLWDCLKSNLYIVSRTPVFYLVLVISGLIHIPGTLGSPLWMAIFVVFSAIIISMLMFLGILAVFIAFLYFTQKQNFRSIFYTVTASFFLIENRGVQSKVIWEAVEKVELLMGYIFFVLHNGRRLTIPIASIPKATYPKLMALLEKKGLL